MNIENLFNFKKNNDIDCNVQLHSSSYFIKSKEIYTMDTYHKNCGVYCKGVSDKKLLIVVGESWTYGDSLHPYVKASDNIDCLSYRISNIFSGKLANFLMSDLLLFAEPGQSNINYWHKLENILDFVFNENFYEEVYLVIQMTSPGRDYNVYYIYDRIKHLFSITPNNLPILTWNEWLYEYDKTYFNWLQEIVLKYPIKSTILWKNFNEFHYKERNLYNFKVIENPFMRYAIEMSGMNVNLSNCLEMTFYENVDKLYNLNISLETMEKELANIDIEFNKLNLSMLNNWHPNENGHWVIASLMREKI